MREVEAVGADFGRVRTIKLEPQDHDTAFRSFHRDDNNRFNPETDGWVVRAWIELTDFPESYMLLMDTGPDGLPDPATEVRLALHRGARFLLDTQRLWHVVVHNGSAPRYALISSFESGPALDAWVQSQLPVTRELRERGFERGVEAGGCLDHRVVADAVEAIERRVGPRLRRAAPPSARPRSDRGHPRSREAGPDATRSRPSTGRSCTCRSSM